MHYWCFLNGYVAEMTEKMESRTLVSEIYRWLSNLVICVIFKQTIFATSNLFKAPPQAWRENMSANLKSIMLMIVAMGCLTLTDMLIKIASQTLPIG